MQFIFKIIRLFKRTIRIYKATKDSVLGSFSIKEAFLYAFKTF